MMFFIGIVTSICDLMIKLTRPHTCCLLCLQELSRRLTVAMTEAHGKSVSGMKEKMKDLAKSLGLPNPAALTGGGPGGF
jgi:hypothetical protein